jgi:hypothetical protein
VDAPQTDLPELDQLKSALREIERGAHHKTDGQQRHDLCRHLHAQEDRYEAQTDDLSDDG